MNLRRTTRKMTPHQLIKRIPKLSDDEAKQICKIILNHKFTIIDHAKKLLEKDQEIYELKSQTRN